MPKYALIQDGQFVRLQDFKRQPEDVPHKKIQWVPYVEESVTSAKTSHTKIVTTTGVVDGKYVVKREVVDKTLDEPSAAEQRQRAQEVDLSLAGAAVGALGKIVLELLNESRGREKLAPLSGAEFAEYLRARL